MMCVGVKFIRGGMVVVGIVNLEESRIILVTSLTTCLLRIVLITLSVKTCLLLQGLQNELNMHSYLCFVIVDMMLYDIMGKKKP